MRCSFCGGTREVTISEPDPPGPPQAQPAESLAGVWHTNGGSWQIAATGNPDVFTVVERGMPGVTANGQLTDFRNGIIGVTMKNGLFGNLLYALVRESPSVLSGGYKMMGVVTPIRLTRA